MSDQTIWVAFLGADDWATGSTQSEAELARATADPAGNWFHVDDAPAVEYVPATNYAQQASELAALRAAVERALHLLSYAPTHMQDLSSELKAALNPEPQQ